MPLWVLGLSGPILIDRWEHFRPPVEGCPAVPPRFFPREMSCNLGLCVLPLHYLGREFVGLRNHAPASPPPPPPEPLSFICSITE